jgi:hypothetical protein
LADVLKHTQAVINVIEGSGGSNYDLSYNAEGFDADPGDGVGVIEHSVQAQTHGELSGSSLVATNAGNVQSWSEGARDAALTVLTQTDPSIAKLPLASTIGFLNSARSGLDAGDQGGADQAYVEAQLAATFDLGAATVVVEPVVPTATPKPEPTTTPRDTATPLPRPTATAVPAAPTATPMPGVGIALPNVGESAVPLISRLVLIASVVLLIGGGALILRNRRSGSRA